MSWLSKITGRQHHFKVTLKFYPDLNNGRTFVTRTCNVWLEDRALIADDRAIRKTIGPVMVNEIPSYRRCNGTLKLCEVYYLGWFRPVQKQEQTTQKLTPKLSQVVELMAVYLGKRT